MHAKLEYALTTVESNELKYEYKSYNYIGSPERGKYNIQLVSITLLYKIKTNSLKIFQVF